MLGASTIEEAVSLLIKHDGKAKVIAGGTDLIPKLTREKTKKLEY